MAKSNLEKQMEKYAKEQKRIETASNIVNQQPIINGFKIMDSSAEELLRIILDNYDGNEERYVNLNYDVLPRRLEMSINIELEKLSQYGVIAPNPIAVVSFAGIYLTSEGINYFESKEKAQKEGQQRPLYKSDKQYDVFISHANKDKLEYVDKLYLTLRKLGVNIFYDSEVISWGDNWKQVILDGTASSEFAIIVISENFFGREWTEKELQEFLQRQNDTGQKIILPLLHNIHVDDFKNKYPDLTDIQAIDTSQYSMEEVTILFAKELIKRLKP